MDALEALQIADYAHDMAGNLPYGVQKRVDLARSLVANPSLLLLDEPAAGLTGAESHQLMELIGRCMPSAGSACCWSSTTCSSLPTCASELPSLISASCWSKARRAEVRANHDVVVAYLGTGQLSASARAARRDRWRDSAATRARSQGHRRALWRGAGAHKRLIEHCGWRDNHDHRRQWRRQNDLALDGQRHRRGPSRARIYTAAHDVTRLTCEQRVAQGIVMCPEGRRLFPEMSVQENLLLGAYNVTDKAAINAALDRVYALFPRIAGRRKQLGGTLSGGEQQMVAIGRALMAAPTLLLLDEPSLGLAPNLVELIFETIAEIRKLGCSIMLVEQNAAMALEVADYGYVLETGKVTLSGLSSDLKERHDVIEAYLG